MRFGNVHAGLRYNIGLHKLADTSLTKMLLGDNKNTYSSINHQMINILSCSKH